MISKGGGGFFGGHLGHSVLKCIKPTLLLEFHEGWSKNTSQQHWCLEQLVVPTKQDHRDALYYNVDSECCLPLQIRRFHDDWKDDQYSLKDFDLSWYH